MPREIQVLTDFLEAGDASSAERQAHTIKGVAANVGGEALRAVAFEMEKASRGGDLDTVKARVAESSPNSSGSSRRLRGSRELDDFFRKSSPPAACLF